MMRPRLTSFLPDAALQSPEAAKHLLASTQSAPAPSPRHAPAPKPANRPTAESPHPSVTPPSGPSLPSSSPRPLRPLRPTSIASASAASSRPPTPPRRFRPTARRNRACERQSSSRIRFPKAAALPLTRRRRDATTPPSPGRPTRKAAARGPACCRNAAGPQCSANPRRPGCNGRRRPASRCARANTTDRRPAGSVSGRPRVQWGSAQAAHVEERQSRLMERQLRPAAHFRCNAAPWGRQRAPQFGGRQIAFPCSRVPLPPCGRRS